jgi:hypothetical protein
MDATIHCASEVTVVTDKMHVITEDGSGMLRSGATVENVTCRVASRTAPEMRSRVCITSFLAVNLELPFSADSALNLRTPQN